MVTKNRIVLKQIQGEASIDMSDSKVPDRSGWAKMPNAKFGPLREIRTKYSRLIELAIDGAHRNQGERSLLYRKGNS